MNKELEQKLEGVVDDIVKFGVSDLMKVSMSFFKDLEKTHPLRYEEICFRVCDRVHSEAKYEMRKYFKIKK